MKWKVDVTETTVYRIEIEADSPEDAELKASDLYSDNDARPIEAGFELIDADTDATAWT